ncbi:hypothetical protein FRC02_003198 [Tulasnella sp. 418]|nr:hypothetical protein FRC02_003198 [Tulasnella sp. 418]
MNSSVSRAWRRRERSSNWMKFSPSARLPIEIKVETELSNIWIACREGMKECLEIIPFGQLPSVDIERSDSSWRVHEHWCYVGEIRAERKGFQCGECVLTKS